MHPFHLAIPVNDIKLAREFYTKILGCSEGRSDRHWVDFNFFGHQLVCHLDTAVGQRADISNPVDHRDVPIPHFGIVLSMSEWEVLVDDLKAKNINFIIKPYIRFKGQTGEQATMFFADPSGNAIEIKAFRDIASQLFAK